MTKCAAARAACTARRTRVDSARLPHGESPTELVRDPKYGFDIYITANGQFLCRSYHDDTASVKYEPIKEGARGDAESGSSDIIFITRADAVWAKLKKAKKVIVRRTCTRRAASR